MGIPLLLVLATPSVVVAGVPDCWVDTRRLNQWLRRSPANDNGRAGTISSSSSSCPS
jgi:hypothetical protein